MHNNQTVTKDFPGMLKLLAAGFVTLALLTSNAMAQDTTPETTPVEAAAEASVVNPALLPEVGVAKPWQLHFQEPASPFMERLVVLHDGVTIVITLITLFVMALLIIIIVKYNAKTNKTPSKTSHNTLLEIAWTAVPILILVGIAIPTLKDHYFYHNADGETPGLTVKVVGYQWYWRYEYPDFGGFGYDSYMLKDEDRPKDKPRLLAVDNPLVVPVDTMVQVLLTGGDVIHAFAMPAMGVKMDAVPGKLNETWFKATKPGIYYGQCSELCGVGHGFMPIELHVLSKEDFKIWVEQAKEEFAQNGEVSPQQLAQLTSE
jgi:cytochrome c oxidase subunit II